MPHTKDKWVIVFLIYADFRRNTRVSRIEALTMTEQMKAELNSLFKDILTVPLDPSRMRMYVVISSIDYKLSDESNLEARTLFYEIGNSSNGRTNEITYCEVISCADGELDRPIPGSSIQEPVFLKSIMSRIPFDEANEEILFCTHDHGSAFGIFREANSGKLNGEIRKPIQFDLERYPYIGVFWNRALAENKEFRALMEKAEVSFRPNLLQVGHTLFAMEFTHNQFEGIDNSAPLEQAKIAVCVQDSTLRSEKLLLINNSISKQLEVWDHRGFMEAKLDDNTTIMASLRSEGIREVLHNEELALVFTDWLKGEKVSVLLMMNCWMMNLHSMYSFRDTVKFLVAPQGNIGTPGYNYRDIFKYLFSSKSIYKWPKDLAIKCVTSVDNKRMRRRSVRLRADHLDMVDNWKIFAMDLQKRKGTELLLINHLNRLESIMDKLIPRSDIVDDATCESDMANKRWEAILLCRHARMLAFDFTKLGLFDENCCFMVDIVNYLHTLCDIASGVKTHGDFPLDAMAISLARTLRDEVSQTSSKPKIAVARSEARTIYGSQIAVVGIPPTGYSLFFPNIESSQENLIENVKKDSLIDKFLVKWVTFLKTVYPKEVWSEYFK